MLGDPAPARMKRREAPNAGRRFSGRRPGREENDQQGGCLMSPSVAKPAARKVKVSRLHKPPQMTLIEWQTLLRRQFAQEQSFRLTNLGKHPVFSEFSVSNPASRRTYRVVVRGEEPGVNFCTCPDYAVNTLGTCKHIEFALHRLRRRYAGALKKGYIAPFSEVFLRYGAERRGMFAAGKGCPEALRRLCEKYFRLDGSLEQAAIWRFDAFVSEATRLCEETGHELRVYDDAVSFIAEQRDARARQERLSRLYEGRGAASAWKGLLKVPLFPYQREGSLFAAKAGRAIIADDMGLGKTIQAIAAAEILARHCGAEKALIICPASLKYQWKSEIEQFSGRPALVIEGQTHQRRDLYQKPGGFFKIVNYDVIHRDLPALAEWRPDLVILDEAQRIKNWQTRAARCVKQIESPFAIVLTGTPLENRLEELHSIVEFVDRNRLGPLFAFKAEHEERDADDMKVIGYRNLGRITQTLAPILLRRTKGEVLKQLPPRMDKNFFVEMTGPQWVPHDENREIVARLVAKWRRFKFLSEADQLRLRIALQYMRMSCDSTYLVDHETRHGRKVDELCKLLGEIFEMRGSKVVIFSQWLRMNELVAEMLEDRKWGHVVLHGGVASKERKDLVAAFRNEPDCRVFLSTDAGGVGLNLQHAANVINMDLPWNPAVLEQRIGRVHRLGQRDPVRVVNFISQHTIEHGMLSLLSFKRSVFAGVLDGAADKVMMGESAMNRFMKTVERATKAVPPAPPADEPELDSAEAAEASAESAAMSGLGGSTDFAAPPAAGAAWAARSADAVIRPPADVTALGRVLAQGADLLSAIGRTLAFAGSGRGGALARGGSPCRIDVDAQTGRRELRLALPDERTLQQWVGRLAEVIGSIAPGA